MYLGLFLALVVLPLLSGWLIIRAMSSYIRDQPFFIVRDNRLTRLYQNIKTRYRRRKLRRSLKARKAFLCFEGMTGFDGTPRASMQCRS